MDDYQRGVWAAYDAARGTNADMCATPIRTYQLMLEAINKLRHAPAPEQKAPAMTDPSPTAELVAKLMSKTDERRLCGDRVYCRVPNTIFLEAAAALISQAAEIARMRKALELGLAALQMAGLSDGACRARTEIRAALNGESHD